MKSRAKWVKIVGDTEWIVWQDRVSPDSPAKRGALDPPHFSPGFSDPLYLNDYSDASLSLGVSCITKLANTFSVGHHWLHESDVSSLSLGWRFSSKKVITF